ncbi:N-acetyltransferase [Marinobacterium zhoushanense]|uniref:N-acetyltransferase n=1 Tax=Marinobacterium zhoushanense TaxID=1679163 RepID=A0ABQ1KDP7_9GAMM|nr:GNAT family N-acetyltransferase [Marinobacterium zhoushanense]GGB93419.1 N-acetyltransferase [Marinobacterium zhoushanense]
MQLFETERLVATPLSLQDVAALTEILSDPEVMKYSIRGVCDAEATRLFIDWCLKCYESHGLGPWALREKGSSELIGFCGVGPEIVREVEETNLGYRLARRYWGQGFATEAVRGVLRYAFDQKKCESVVVIIEPEHVASVRVTEKAGFGEYTVQEFHNRPVRLYRMTCEDWALHNQ